MNELVMHAGHGRRVQIDPFNRWREKRAACVAVQDGTSAMFASPGCDDSVTSWYESVYAHAKGDVELVPWARGVPSPLLVEWLNTKACCVVRPGSRVCVVGCGLGDDVAELASRGYDVLGFDVSASAIDWAQQRFHEVADRFLCTDVLHLPCRFRHRFDLVVEIDTIQSVLPEQREAAVHAICDLVGPLGHVLAIARGRDESEPLEEAIGPPWPLTENELVGLMANAGTEPAGDVEWFEEPDELHARRMRCLFERVHG